jgi:hypothetical protein
MKEPSTPASATPLFPLGQLVATPGALALLERLGIQPATLLSRHVRGDWGTLSGDDRQANTEALSNGARILSSYPVGVAERVWIITEADRSSTTVLLPSEY